MKLSAKRKVVVKKSLFKANGGPFNGSYLNLTGNTAFFRVPSFDARFGQYVTTGEKTCFWRWKGE